MLVTTIFTAWESVPWSSRTPKVTVWFPAWSYDGVHSNSPEASSKVAPAGKSEAVYAKPGVGGTSGSLPASCIVSNSFSATVWLSIVSSVGFWLSSVGVMLNPW